MKANTAYQYFWAVAISCGFLACVNYVSEENTTLDINIHDTYFVIARMYLYILSTLFYFSCGLIYKVSDRLQLNGILTKIHTWVTVGGFVAYFILWAITSKLHDPKDTFDRTQEIKQLGMLIAFTLIFLAQPLFIVNMLIGSLKAFRK